MNQDPDVKRYSEELIRLQSSIGLLQEALDLERARNSELTKTFEAEVMTRTAELSRKNTYLEHAAKILRHDMHSGINTYLPDRKSTRLNSSH